MTSLRPIVFGAPRISYQAHLFFACGRSSGYHTHLHARPQDFSVCLHTQSWVSLIPSCFARTPVKLCWDSLWTHLVVGWLMPCSLFTSLWSFGRSTFSSRVSLVLEWDNLSLECKASCRRWFEFLQLQQDGFLPSSAWLQSSAYLATVSVSANRCISSTNLWYQDPFVSQFQHVTSQISSYTPWAWSEPFSWLKLNHTQAASIFTAIQPFHSSWQVRYQPNCHRRS